MNLKKLLNLYSDKYCNKIYVKTLAANDNSKQQVYFGGNFEVLNIFPLSQIIADTSGSRKTNSFKTKLNFYWLLEDGRISHAPDSQLILYPDYPEVRFSGFLRRAKDAPSDLMNNRQSGRLLFLGISNKGSIFGFVTPPDSQVANEFNSLNLSEVGVFKEITVENGQLELNPKEKLLSELKRIHLLGWIDAKRLNSKKQTLPCISSNCGGYTLEAELGITPNGYSEPDYLGWEVKQFAVKNFEKVNSSIITLMTPEPTHGYYVDSGIEAFIRKYGYEDKLGREARLNFGGVYKSGTINITTGLKLIVNGFEPSTKKITNPDGFIALVDKDGALCASWSFISLLKHWNTKHANACYIPSLNRKDATLYTYSKQQYYFGNQIILGRKTDFSLFLDQISKGIVYYDPGIKLELAISGQRKQNIKRRSQFRIKSGNLANLYFENESVFL